MSQTVSYERGHLTPNQARNRNRKDTQSTFLFSNAIPQHPDANKGGSPWYNLERDLRKTYVDGNNDELYITAGSLGTKIQPVEGGTPGETEFVKIPLPNDNISTPNERFINVPQYIWQFVLVLDQPGYGLEDVIDGTATAEAIAVMMPNYKYSDAMTTQPITLPTGQVVDINSFDDWKNWETWRVNGNDLEAVTGLDFLSNLPELLQDDLEDAGVSSSLSAPLLAESEETLPTIKIPDTAIGHNSVAENSAISIDIPINTSQISLDENTISQGNMFYPSSAQGSPSKINTVEIGLHDDDVIQIGSVENSSTGNRFRDASPTQVGIKKNPIINADSAQHSPAQVSPTEVSSFEFSSTEIGVGEITPSQISTPKISPTEIGVGEITPSQISTPKISPTFKLGVSEISSTQISVPEIGSNDSDLAKIPLASGISSNQFLSSHNSTSYNFDNSASLLATDSEIINPRSVEYNPETNTATLYFDAFDTSKYQLTIDDNLQNPDGITLKQPYQVDFTAVSDFSELVDLKFTNTRSDRKNHTISFDVSLTNQTDYDLSLPLNLVLQPGNNSETAQPTDYESISENGAYWIDLSDTLPDGILKPGQSITEQTVTVYNPDDLRFEYEPGFYTLPTTNKAPVFTSQPVTTATAGESYIYNVAANDPDGTVIGYLLYDAPKGMEVDKDGVITWSPTTDSPAQANVSLHAYDSRGGRAIQEFAIAVTGGNQAPVFTPLPKEIKGAEGKAIKLNLSATDGNNDNLQYWVDNLLPGASFDPKTKIFTWTPSYESAGTYEDVRFVVTDGLEEVATTTTFLIAQGNQAPSLLPIPEKTFLEGDNIRIQLQASDTENDKLTFSSNLLPGGSFLDPNTGVFEWTPGFFQAGEYEIPFTVSDGSRGDSRIAPTQKFKLEILNVNAAPQFDDLGNWAVAEGQTLNFRAFAFDADNPSFIPQERTADGQLTLIEGSDPSVTYTVTGLPEGATFDVETAIFNWKPGYDAVGEYTVTFTATDDGDGKTPKTVTKSVSIKVGDTNRPPVIAEITNPTVQGGEVLDLAINTTDPDGNALTVTGTGFGGFGLPDFATLTDNGDGTAKLHIAPGDGDRGDHPVTIIATDELGVSKEYSFILTVEAFNERPLLNHIGNKVAVVGQPVDFKVSVADLDQDNLTFSTTGLPPGATLTPSSTYGQATFSWTPTAANLGNYPITIKVEDSGNGDSTKKLSSQQSFNLTVRTSNTAPVLAPVSDRSLAEGETLSVQLVGTDADGDTLTYSAKNLPRGAELDPVTGLLTWTPDFQSAGTYAGIELIASDGHSSSSQTLKLTVTNSDRSSVLVPLPLQSTRENTELVFNLKGNDIDGDPILYSAVSQLPTGAKLDSRTGEFKWKPNYGQAGDYTLQFAVTDSNGQRDIKEVEIVVNNVNRLPKIAVKPQIVALGEELEFTLLASDPDLSPTPQSPNPPTSLQYSAANLPEGATLNPETGVIKWQPSPGQVGDYVVTYQVSDGEDTVEKNALIRVETEPSLPVVDLEFTPSFAPIPGQKVTINALADSFTEIAEIKVVVNGKELALDSRHRATYTPETTGRIEIEVTATDIAGRTASKTEILKVRDPEDDAKPLVAFGLGLNGEAFDNVTDIKATVSDRNLDEWNLSIFPRREASPLGQAPNSLNPKSLLATGYGAVNNKAIASFDPALYSNGFYTLELTATDIKGRTSTTEIVVEVDGSDKTAQYQRTDSDLTVDFDGTAIALSRRYDSLQRNESGSFGNGWTSNWDFDLETSIPTPHTLHDALANPLGPTPYQQGTRLYLTTPDGDRVGFTFQPVATKITGLTYYKPSWVADAGVNYSLESSDALLSKAGDRFYDLQTAKPYNLKSEVRSRKGLSRMQSEGSVYTLTSVDGNVYNLDSAGNLRSQVAADGTRLIFSDSGILNPESGEMVRFEADAAGRLTKITAPNGTTVIYDYDQAGNLIAVRDLAQGESVRYSYGEKGLNLIAGDTGEAIAYLDTPVVKPITQDLGTASSFTGKTITGNSPTPYTLTPTPNLYSFALRESELKSTNSGSILLGVDLTGTDGAYKPPNSFGGQRLDQLPTIEGLSPVSSTAGFALFAIDQEGLNLLSVKGNGDYQLRLGIAGDVNSDNAVNGLDSQLVTEAIATGNYDAALDVNRDRTINAADLQILGSNYGFRYNQVPVVKDGEAITHEDLSVEIPLADLAKDPEGDPVGYAERNRTYFQARDVEHGTVTFTPDGQKAIFKPAVGYTGTASFKLLADDGYGVSDAAIVEIQVSDAPLTGMDFVERNPKLEVREQVELQVVADFADQEDVVLPGDYLTWNSVTPGVASLSDRGSVTGVKNGTTIFSAERDGLTAVTASRVGDIPAPIDDASFNLALAEEQGLDIYPDASTLTVGTDRQILVGIEGKIETPDLLSDADVGTKYFVSNPEVLTVDENGLITTLSVGEADVTVVHGAAEAILPVNVEVPNIGATTLGVEGGVVEGEDGLQVMIPQGALAEDTTVDISSRQQAELNIEIPEDFSFISGFNLQVGEKQLEQPVQLAIPAPEGLEVGQKVFFMREDEIPNETGAMEPIWMMEESGIVGSDGMIRTSSPPWGGAKREGNYSIVVPTFQFDEAQYNYGLAAIGFGTVLGVGGIYIAATFGSKSGIGSKVGLVVAGAGINIAAYGGFLVATAGKTTITTIVVPKVGLPLSMDTEIGAAEVNLKLAQGQSVPVFDIPVAPLLDQLSLNIDAPSITRTSIDFDAQGSLIRVKGNNFNEDDQDLKVNLTYGSQKYIQEQVKIESAEELTFRVPNHLPLSSELRFNISKGELSSRSISLNIDQNIERAVTVQRLSDEIYFIDTSDPKTTINNSDVGSSDLILAKVPVGDPTQPDLPRELASTSDASRIYIPLEKTHSIAVVDGIGFRNLDTNLEKSGINPINFGAGATPSSIVISSDDRFAYIGDRNTGTIYLLNIDPNSKDYHTYSILNIPGSSGIRQLALNSDGTRLFATTNEKIIAFDTAIESDTQHQILGSVIAKLPGLEGIASTPYPDKMIFTNRLDESVGYGYLNINNNDPDNFQFSIGKQIILELGNSNDYFDVNEAIAVEMLRTKNGKEYAFVAGRNSRNLGQRIADVDDDPRAGSSIGIIQNPLSDPKLVAALKPVPNGYLSDLSLSSDRKYLTATYPLAYSSAIYDVEQIIKTVENNPSSGSKNLTNTPLEEFNPAINIASEFAKDLAEGAEIPKNVPVSTGTSLGITPQSKQKLIETTEVELPQLEEEDGEVILKWTPKDNLTIAPDTETEAEPEPDKPITLTDIPNLGIYVSTFPEGEGLVPGDWSPDGYETGEVDYNPNRVLTAEFIEGAWNIIKDGVRTVTGQTDPYQFRLPKLTAGQTYHWAVQVKGVISSAVIDALSLDFGVDSQSNTFTVPLAKLNDLPNDPFTSVTVLTRGIEPTGLANQPNEQNMNALAAKMEKEGSSVMKYYPDHGWQLVKSYRDSNGQINWQLNPGVIQQDKPLVLLADWIDNYSNTSAIHNAGFAEAAADTMFASLVQLDNGQVGANGAIHDSQGNLIRSLGSIFSSPLHFVGFGQGAVVNSEIIQRIGTYFSKDRYDIPDIQMTTVDPFNYTSGNSSGTYANILDPKITAWENVSYVDNYSGRQATDLNLQTDWDIDFNEQSYAGFDGTLSENDRHQNALLWYTGTANVSYDPSVLNPDQKIYRRLGDLYPSEASDSPTLSTNWYTPDHTNANFQYGDANAPWEGIGTGWYHSVLGGGYDTRPYGNINNKQSKDDIGDFEKYLKDNRTSVTQLRGDFAVPTLFNGNYDAIKEKLEQPIPGWFNDGSEDKLQKYLNFGVKGNQSYALELGTGLDSITHNPFVVPDWGVLRFDLAVKNANGGTVKVTLEGEDVNETQTISLTEANGPWDLGYNDADTYKIGYGTKGFETFHIQVPDALRGKVATLKFEVDGNSVFLDDVFFKSEHLLLGNPSNARNTSPDNYLIERPQYSLSYNNDNKGSNWVAWPLNKSWLGDLRRPGNTGGIPIPDDYPGRDTDFPFQLDPALPTNFNRLNETDYRLNGQSSYYHRGHLARSSDRSRTAKDQLSTYFMSNILPQTPDNNTDAFRSPWQQLENHSTSTLVGAGKELNIYAGGYGSRTPYEVPFLNPPQNGTQTNPLETKNINVPSFVWKVIVGVNQPGTSLGDIESNSSIVSDAVAVLIPNIQRPRKEDPNNPGQWLKDPNDPQGKRILFVPFSETIPATANFPARTVSVDSINDWKDWTKWTIPIRHLEELTGLNFLSNLSDSAQNNIENIVRLTLPIEINDSLDDIDDDESIDKTANLLADLPLNKSTKTSVEVFRPFNQMSFLRNSIVEKSSSKSSIESFSTSQRSLFEIRSLHGNHFKIGLAEIGSTQVTSHEASSAQINPRKIGIRQITSTENQFRQTSPTQVNFTKIDLYEPSFSSSIPSEQFFSIHNSKPKIINVLNNSPTNTDSFGGQNIEPEAIYGIKSTNAPLTNIPDSRWVSSLNPTYAIGDRTFHIQVPDALRGKVATLKFEVDGNSVFLDDVFFKSEHLLLGNPTLNGKPARASIQNFSNNYLVERPQYTISYSDPFKGPNWVAYKLAKYRTKTGEPDENQLDVHLS